MWCQSQLILHSATKLEQSPILQNQSRDSKIPHFGESFLTWAFRLSTALKRSHFRSWFEPPPSYVIARGPKAVAAYQRAKETGKILDRRVKVLLIGQDRVGKTSVGRSLKGEPFRANETSTDGVQMHTPLKNPGIQPWKFSVMQQETTAYHHKCAEYIGRELLAEAKAEETRVYKEFINTFPRPTKRPRPTNRLNHESLDLILDLTGMNTHLWIDLVLNLSFATDLQNPQNFRIMILYSVWGTCSYNCLIIAYVHLLCGSFHP